MEVSITAKAVLNNGVEMPLLGLGTWKTSPEMAEEAVRAALKLGYRHIDTAAAYGNEEGVARGIRQSGLPREEIFVTTKLWNDDHDNVVGALNASLERLQLDYVDLYLIHWPVPQRNQSWKVLEQLHGEGKCRAIGVSNFTIPHLKKLIEIAEITPAVNQVEFTPYLYQKELHEFCKSKKIQLEAYSPLTQGQKLNDPKLVKIAAKHGKTAAQVMIRWALQHGIAAIPKSARKERIAENANVFDFQLDEKDMTTMDSLNENLRLCWDPNNMP